MAIELTNKTVLCRKEHKCDWCGEKIKKDEKAQYRTGIYDGEFFHGHMHIECHNAMMDSDYDDFDDGSFDLMSQKRGKTMGESHQ